MELFIAQAETVLDDSNSFILKGTKKRSVNCSEIVCGWPLCPDDEIPVVQDGDCCPSCPGTAWQIIKQMTFESHV